MLYPSKFSLIFMCAKLTEFSNHSVPKTGAGGVRAAQVDPRKIETHIYVYGGELADPGPSLRQAVLNVTPRPIAMWSLN